MSKAPQQYWWVSGAGSGIGRALALRLARQGHRVYISGRRLEPLLALAAELPENLLPLPLDVTDAGAVTLALQQHPQAPRHLDGVVLSAGICEYVDLPQLDVERLRRVMEVNYFGVANCVNAALPLLLAAARGGTATLPQLVGISSMSTYVGFPRAEAYGSAKAAMAYLLDSLRCDLHGQVNVTVVYPGFVDTPLTASNDFPMPFLLDADAAAAYIERRLGQGRRALPFPWQLHWLLRLAALLPALWYGPIMARLTHKRGA